MVGTILQIKINPHIAATYLPNTRLSIPDFIQSEFNSQFQGVLVEISHPGLVGMRLVERNLPSQDVYNENVYEL